MLVGGGQAASGINKKSGPSLYSSLLLPRKEKEKKA
jgi:hypothetical protein